VIETLPINELIDDVLTMNAPALDATGFQILRELDESIPLLALDRHKLMQILVNLVRNARHALADAGLPEPCLTVRTKLEDHARLRITVADNGIGIPRENLTRIFEHGFTTRKTGHGFGLHSCAVTAQEMGGSLRVASAGPGQGAVFTLEIPTQERTA
jgi:signal transduction histidine kinase